MRRLAKIACLILLLAGSAAAANAPVVVDRIIETVNNEPILLSDWEESWRCEALLAGRAPESYGAAEQQEMFGRLVDQELLRQQIHNYFLPPVTAEDIEKRLQEVRAQLSAKDDATWQKLLSQAGVTEPEAKAHLQRELEMERLIDTRFRAGIRIEGRAVSSYYREVFLPELRQAGAGDVPLEEVSGKIREILVQQRMNEQVIAWLQTLREQAEILIPQPSLSDLTEVEVSRSK